MRVLVIFALLLMVWQLVAEVVEPHRTVPLLALYRPRSPPIELPAIGGTVLRLYADTRPHVGKITSLQKGLVWVVDGRELTEEAYGFGCPILLVDGVGYVSQHARVSLVEDYGVPVIEKRFSMDTIDTPIEFLRRKYRPVPPIGEVVFIYRQVAEGVLDVIVDLSGIGSAWQQAYLMNEQGANAFTRFRDSDGLNLDERGLGIWSTTKASSACFHSKDERIGFCVEPNEDATLYYGRERYLQYNWRGTYYLSWSGIDIELEGPRESYGYRIVLHAADDAEPGARD